MEGMNERVKPSHWGDLISICWERTYQRWVWEIGTVIVPISQYPSKYGVDEFISSYSSSTCTTQHERYLVLSGLFSFIGYLWWIQRSRISTRPGHRYHIISYHSSSYMFLNRVYPCQESSSHYPVTFPYTCSWYPRILIIYSTSVCTYSSIAILCSSNPVRGRSVCLPYSLSGNRTTIYYN